MSTAAPNKPQGTSTGYSVARAEGNCHACGKAIAPGDKFMAALRDTPAGLERLGICLDSWPTFERKDLLGFWQAVMPHPNEKKKLFVDDEVLCELFERLADAAEPVKVNFRFVLGLILMRKRRIVYESTRHEADKEIWSVRFKGREEDMLDLCNPKLNEEQVTEVSTQLGEILNDVG